VFDLNVEHPLDEELLVEELEMDALKDADKLDGDDLLVEDADELDDLQQLEDAGDLNINAQHLHNIGSANVSFSFPFVVSLLLLSAGCKQQ
jgi:hypothetical protein